MGLTCRDLDCIVGRVCSLQHKSSKVYHAANVAQLLPQHDEVEQELDVLLSRSAAGWSGINAYMLLDAFDQI